MTKDICTSGCVFWNQADECCDLMDFSDEDFKENCPAWGRDEEQGNENEG